MTILFAHLDITDQIKTPQVRDHVASMMLEQLGGLVTIVDNNFDALLDKAAKNKLASHVVVIRSGYFSALDKAALRSEVMRFCSTNRDFMVAGHIVATGSYPSLLPDFLIVDLHALRSVATKPQNVAFTVPEMSADDLYSGSGPLWLKPTEEKTKRINSIGFGSLLINAALSNGFMVRALPEAIRAKCFNVHPLTSPAHLGAALDKVSRGETPDLRALDEDQTRFIQSLQDTRYDGSPSLFDNDGLTCPEQQGLTGQRFSKFVCVAGGFRPFYLWSCFTRNHPTLVTYDWRQENLDFWQMLVREWDTSEDLIAFLEKRKDLPAGIARRVSVYPKEALAVLYKHFGTKEHFHAEWRRYRDKDHHFVRCDILSGGGIEMLKDAPWDTLLWTSDILSSPYNQRLGGRAMMQARAKQIAVALTDNPDIVWLGNRPDGTFMADPMRVVAQWA